MSIWIIRHGETAGNADRVVQVPETPLSDRGRSQAAALGARLARQPIARILASDYARAAMTAEAVRATTSVAIESEPLLRERNFGDVRGTSYAELSERGIDIMAPDWAPPGGEDWESFHARVDRAWERVRALAAEIDGDLAVVTHGLVCYSLVEHHLLLPDGSEPVFGFANTSATLVEPAPPWRIRLLNCTEHLETADRSGPGSGPA